MKFKLACFSCYLLLIVFNNKAFSQNNEKLLKFSAEQNLFLTYSGLNMSFIGAVNYKKHSLGAGINTSLVNSYFPYSLSSGIILDYKYYFLSNNKVKAFVSANYFNTRYTTQGRDNSNPNKLNEFIYSNGFIIRLYKGLWIGNSIGAGAYNERFYDVNDSKYRSNNGFNYRINLLLKYDF